MLKKCAALRTLIESDLVDTGSAFFGQRMELNSLEFCPEEISIGIFHRHQISDSTILHFAYELASQAFRNDDSNNGSGEYENQYDINRLNVLSEIS